MPADISRSHRLGKRPINQVNDKRNIIVKLCRRDMKRDILSACRNMKPNMYVNESLTPVRNTIMYVLRQAKRKRHSRVVGCTSIGGRVFAWVKPDGDTQQNSRHRKVQVNTHMDLETLFNDVLKEPLDEYLQSWPH